MVCTVAAGTPASHMPTVTGTQTAASATIGRASRTIRLRSQGTYSAFPRPR